MRDMEQMKKAQTPRGRVLPMVRPEQKSQK
jgi:hypothetical protein